MDIRDINLKSPAAKSMKFNPNDEKDFKSLLTACTSLSKSNNMGYYDLLRRVDDFLLSLPLELIEEVVSHLSTGDALSLLCIDGFFTSLPHQAVLGYMVKVK